MYVYHWPESPWRFQNTQTWEEKKFMKYNQTNQVKHGLEPNCKRASADEMKEQFWSKGWALQRNGTKSNQKNWRGLNVESKPTIIACCSPPQDATFQRWRWQISTMLWLRQDPIWCLIPMIVVVNCIFQFQAPLLPFLYAIHGFITKRKEPYKKATQCNILTDIKLWS